MATPCHTRGSLKAAAAALPLRIQKRTFSETFIAYDNKATLKKVRATKSVSRPIRDLRAPFFAVFTFSFSFNYHMSSRTACEAVPMEGVEATNAFTFQSHYYSSTGTACEAVPMEGVEYTGPCQLTPVHTSGDGAVRKMAVPKSRRHDVARDTCTVAPESASDDKKESVNTSEEEPIQEKLTEEVVTSTHQVINLEFDEEDFEEEEFNEEEFDKYYDEYFEKEYYNYF